MKPVLKYLGLVSVILVGWVLTAGATITVPNVFAPFTTISSTAMNSNFSTVAEAALNRHGDAIDGTITGSGSLTISGKVQTTSTAADAFKTGGGITAGSGVVGIVGTDGRIPAFSSTYFASTSVSASNLTGLLQLVQYNEQESNFTISGGGVTFDLSTATYFVGTLNGNVSVTITNPAPAAKVSSFTSVWIANGTPFTITWPGTVHWQGGVAPTPTSTNGKKDVYAFFTYDGGASYFGIITGQGF